MSSKLNSWDFRWKPLGYGHYEVLYTSPVTGKKWNTRINDAWLIDSVFNTENPTQANMRQLLKRCKNR